jgi:hypothetical protein
MRQPAAACPPDVILAAKHWQNYRVPQGQGAKVPGCPSARVELTATGTETRQALVLILHDSSQPHTTPASGWTPKGLCQG